jgi:hypothetical protein
MKVPFPSFVNMDVDSVSQLFGGKLSPGPKNGLERRVSRFSTICAKNQVLKLKIDKVTVIRAKLTRKVSFPNRSTTPVKGPN